MWHKLIFLTLVFIFGCSLAFLVTEVFAANNSASYSIFADVFNAGGTESSNSASYSLRESIGEAIISNNASATSTSSSYGIKSGFRELYPDQALTFSIADTAVNLGTLNRNSASTDTNTMVVATNAFNGFSITATGNNPTLTSGANTITAIGAIAAASTVGVEQFGINLVANTTPAVGANPSGTAPIGSAASQYNTANLFAWSSGATVANSTVEINSTTFTVAYVANISPTTEVGTYNLTITYAATANF